MKIAGFHNLPNNGLILVKEGLGLLLCLEGTVALRPYPGLTAVPLSPERHAKHRLVRKKNRILAKSAENFWSFAQDALRKPQEESRS